MLRLFEKSERSTFPYWFAHWCAFQMVALRLGVWKPRHLFHDFEKPWLRMVWSYDKVKKWHRRNRRHHLGYKDPSKICWLDVVIDWECSRFTKLSSPETAYEYYMSVKEDRFKDRPEWRQSMEQALKSVGLWETYRETA